MTFILEHFELQHKQKKDGVEDTPTSPSSDSDAIMALDNCDNTAPRPGSTPGTGLDNIPNGCAISIYSGTLRGGEVCLSPPPNKCMFCEFSTSDKEALSYHYAHHGIKNIQPPEQFLDAVSQASEQIKPIKNHEKEDIQVVSSFALYLKLVPYYAFPVVSILNSSFQAHYLQYKHAFLSLLLLHSMLINFFTIPTREFTQMPYYAATLARFWT